MTVHTQDVATLSRSLYEAYNRHDINSMLPMVSDQFEWLDVPMNARSRGKEGFKNFVQNWLTGFPDAKVEIKKMVVSDNMVVTEFIGTGTHKGPYVAMGEQIPATNKRMQVPFCEVTQFKDGKVLSSHLYYDVITLARQLGLALPSHLKAA